MKVLLTGVSGYIGQYLGKRLTHDGHYIIGVGRSKKPAGRVSTGAGSNFRWHKADLAEGLSIPDDIDAIVHAAARTPRPKVTIDDYVSGNIIATQNLIEFAIQKKVRAFIYLSATSVYGQIDSTVIDEGTPINKPTAYGMTKYIAELLLRAKEAVIPSVTLRLPTVVGAGMKSGWLFNTYETLLKGEPAHIYNGDSPYNMVHISDVCDLASTCLDYNSSGSTVFTVSCQDFLSIREIVNAIKQYTQSKSEIREEFTDEKGFTISTEKARRVLGFSPKPATEIITKFLEEKKASDKE